MDPTSALFWTAAIIAAMAVGMSKGGLPGVGTLSVPILALVMNPVVAAGLLLPVYIFSDAFGLYVYRRHYDKRLLRLMIPSAVVGVGLGWAAASTVPEWLVTGIIGMVGLSFALNYLLRDGANTPARPFRAGAGFFWSMVAGFTSFVSHAGGPPYQVFVQPLKLEKLVFAGTTTILFAAVNAAKLIPYYALGTLNYHSLQIALFLLVPAMLAVFLGRELVRLLPQKRFFQLITLLLLLVSLKLLWDAVQGSGLV